MLAGKSIMSSYALRYSWPDRKRRINNRKRTESERPRASDVKGATMKRTGGEINQGCRGEKRGEERYREVDESR
jgi:hypothetical protein